MTQEAYTVVGMTCDHCARSVAAEVSAVDGVTNVPVDLTSGLVNVTSGLVNVTSGLVNVTAVQRVPVAAVQAAVAGAGYTLAS